MSHPVLYSFFLPLVNLEKLLLFRQTLFGLPWMLLGGLLAYMQPDAVAPSLLTWFYMIAAFCAARFSGMCFNRLIDRHIDAKNPRTSQRALPKGEISWASCSVQAAVFLGIFFYLSFLLGPLCFRLSFVISALLILYSYTKRFTFACHFVLGLIQFFAPVCAWVVLTGGFSIAPVILGFALFCSMAAGDIIYACQDVEFDKNHHLYSVPVRIGVPRALILARILHATTIGSLLVVGHLLNLQAFFYFGICVVAGLYLISHRKLAISTKVATSFDNCFSITNKVSGLTLFLCTYGDFLWRVLL